MRFDRKIVANTVSARTDLPQAIDTSIYFVIRFELLIDLRQCGEFSLFIVD